MAHTLHPTLLLALLSCACSSNASTVDPADVRASSEPTVTTGDPDEPANAPGSPTPPGSPAASTPTCDDRHAAVRAAVERARAADDGCTFDVDCIDAPFTTACGSLCGIALHPRGLAAFEAETARIDTELCAPLIAAECAPIHAECARGDARCVDGHCAAEDGDAPLRDTPIPEQNARDRADTPPPRPPTGDADERARRLFDAIVRDEPDRARDFFFPREAFAKVKAMTEPDAYWQRLFARYQADIHALHASLPDLSDAEYVGLDIVRRGGWVAPGEEGNALPYHAARHNVLRYRVHGQNDGQDDGRARSLEVRVLITWGDRWYITHLSELR